MALDIGTRLGPYEITGRLGAGGMGQVFKARDTRLNRTVAIKVSNEAFTERFEHEARAVAAVNHPNICQLYDVGPNYLVLEHVAGAPVIPTENKRKLLDIAVQIADGMAAAHEAGFVHRDLKPSNVFVTPEGRVKILDFGLVKNVARDKDGEPALTVTAQGLVAGTTAYMSPEQARGEPTLDARSDQFSFGLLLYELATGKRPFDRATGIETLAAIIRDDPEPLPTTIPAPLRWIIARCIAKEPRDRYGSSRDLYLELKSVQAHFADVSTIEQQAAVAVDGAAPRTRWQGVATFAGGVALTVAVVWALGVRVPREDPDLRVTPFSSEGGGQGAAVWSPDGRSVAYAARKLQTEPYQVYVRDLDSRLPRQITHAKNSAVPIQWTTTGQIILMSAGEILSILEVGGEPERLLELRDAVVVAVSRDGSSLASYEADGEIHVRSPLTAEPQRYEPAPFEETRSDWLPQLAFSPEGTHLLLLTASAGWIMPYPADSKVPPRRILESLGVPASPISHRFSWLNDRHIIVQSASRGSTGSADLFVADTRSGKVSAVRPPGITSLTELAASPDGSKVVFQQRIIAHDIVNMSLEDATVTPYIATARNEEGPTWAAREPAMAYVTDRSGPSEIWLHEEGREDRPIVTGADFFGGPQMLGVPSLAPDGTRVIYFRAALEGAPQPGLYISAVAGGSPVLLAAVTGSVAGGSWSPDGNWFVYTEGTASGPKTLKKVRTSPRAEPEPLRSLSVLAPLAPRWSPQGDWILYGDGGLKLIAEDGGNVRELGFGAVCTFTRDGSHLYCLTPTGAEWRLRYLDLDGKIERDLGSVANEDSPRALFGNGLGLSMRPDGVNVTYAVQRSSENLSMLEGLDTVPLP